MGQPQQRQPGHRVKHGDRQHGGVAAGEADQQARHRRADHVDQRIYGRVERVGAVASGCRDQEWDQRADAGESQRTGQRIDRRQAEQQRRRDGVEPAGDGEAQHQNSAGGHVGEDRPRRADPIQQRTGERADRHARRHRRERHPAGEHRRAKPVERVEHDGEREHARRQPRQAGRQQQRADVGEVEELAVGE